jgi:hypothetical protein
MLHAMRLLLIKGLKIGTRVYSSITPGVKQVIGDEGRGEGSFHHEVTKSTKIHEEERKEKEEK